MDNGVNTVTSNLQKLPISGVEFNALIEPILTNDIRHLAVGVSGGSDSLALTWLLRRWCGRVGIRLTGLIVDHRLRPNSSEEALKVSGWLKNWGLNYKILPWAGKKPNTGIQASARAARYKIMLCWCIQNGIRDLLLAHHQEDQAETFLMRLSRGSGIDGLACMRMITKREGVRLLRPLLAVPKSRLKATLDVLGQEWLEDPSNTNPAFARTLMRELSNALDMRGGGVDAERLAALAGEFGRMRGSLEDVTLLVIDRAARIFDTGWATIDYRFLIRLPDEIARRVMAYLLRSIGGRPYPPRRKRLDRAIELIKHPQKRLAFSLGGCSVSQRYHQLIILREEWRKTPPEQISKAGCIFWRGVFNCKFKSISNRDAQVIYLAPLGQMGWEQVVKERPEVRETSIPHAVALTLPALFDDQGVVKVPHLNYWRKELNKSHRLPIANFVSADFVQLGER